MLFSAAPSPSPLTEGDNHRERSASNQMVYRAKAAALERSSRFR